MQHSENAYGGLFMKYKGVYIAIVMTVTTLSYDLCVYNFDYLRCMSVGGLLRPTFVFCCCCVIDKNVDIKLRAHEVYL